MFMTVLLYPIRWKLILDNKPLEQKKTTWSALAQQIVLPIV